MPLEDGPKFGGEPRMSTDKHGLKSVCPCFIRVNPWLNLGSARLYLSRAPASFASLFPKDRHAHQRPDPPRFPRFLSRKTAHHRALQFAPAGFAESPLHQRRHEP